MTTNVSDEEKLNYMGMVPIPSLGDFVSLGGTGDWRVTSRHFCYWTADGTQMVKVSIQVKQK